MVSEKLVERANRTADNANDMLQHTAEGLALAHTCRQLLSNKCGYADKRVFPVQHEGQLEQGAAGEAAYGTQGDAANSACVQCPAGSL